MNKELIQRINVGDAKRCTSGTLAYLYNESVWGHYVNLAKNDNSEESKVSNVLEMTKLINPDCELKIRIELDYHNFRLINSQFLFKTCLQSSQPLHEITPIYTLNAIRDLKSTDLANAYNELNQDETITSPLEEKDTSKMFDDAILCLKELHKTLVGLIYPYEPTTDVRSHLAKQIFAFNSPEYQTPREMITEDDNVPEIHSQVFNNIGDIINEYPLDDIRDAIDHIVMDIGEKSSYEALVGSIVQAAAKNTPYTKEIAQHLLNSLTKELNPRAPHVAVFDAIAKAFFHIALHSRDNNDLLNVYISNIELLYDVQCQFDNCDYRNNMVYFNTGKLYRVAIKQQQTKLIETMYNGHIRYHQEENRIELSNEQRNYFKTNFDVTAMLIKRSKSVNNLPSTLIYLAGGILPLARYFDKSDTQAFTWLVQSSRELHDMNVIEIMDNLPDWQNLIVIEELAQ